MPPPGSRDFYGPTDSVIFKGRIILFERINAKEFTKIQYKDDDNIYSIDVHGNMKLLISAPFIDGTSLRTIAQAVPGLSSITLFKNKKCILIDSQIVLFSPDYNLLCTDGMRIYDEFGDIEARIFPISGKFTMVDTNGRIVKTIQIMLTLPLVPAHKETAITCNRETLAFRSKLSLTPPRAYLSEYKEICTLQIKPAQDGALLIRKMVCHNKDCNILFTIAINGDEKLCSNYQGRSIEGKAAIVKTEGAEIYYLQIGHLFYGVCYHIIPASWKVVTLFEIHTIGSGLDVIYVNDAVIIPTSQAVRFIKYSSSLLVHSLKNYNTPDLDYATIYQFKNEFRIYTGPFNEIPCIIGRLVRENGTTKTFKCSNGAILTRSVPSPWSEPEIDYLEFPPSLRSVIPEPEFTPDLSQLQPIAPAANTAAIISSPPPLAPLSDPE